MCPAQDRKRPLDVLVFVALPIIPADKIIVLTLSSSEMATGGVANRSSCPSQRDPSEPSRGMRNDGTAGAGPVTPKADGPINVFVRFEVMLAMCQFGWTRHRQIAIAVL
eukprot:gb/GEZJ01011784.1/.p1 GENE.gb/GEZJ01011784.1/~~gb/GEZJ01011784.1/.p1  ORF type:complete len:109 (+),score=6.74 gb/GEZJ01011784.1/:271-597(+)